MSQGVATSFMVCLSIFVDILSKPSLVLAFKFVVVCNISASQVGNINKFAA